MLRVAVAGCALQIVGLAGATSVCAPCEALECASGICHDGPGCPTCVMIADGMRPPVPICGEFERLDTCGGLCEATCEDQNPICPRLCQLINKCVCMDGYLRDDGDCIKPLQCPLEPAPPTNRPSQIQCGPGEEFGCGCEGTCDQPNVFCPAVCVRPRCHCQRGFVRHQGSCIRQSTCPRPECGENEQWSHCGNVCDGSCDDPHPICTRECRRPGACKCRPGFVREGEVCVELSRCSRGEGEPCGFVFAPTPWAGDCADGLECLCVGACANPQIMDAPSTCVRPAAAGMRWSQCTKSRNRLSRQTIASQENLATSCNRKQCRAVQTAEDCRNLRWGNCDGRDCAGANWNSRSKVCRLCKSIGGGELEERNSRQIALAAARDQQRTSGPSTAAIAGLVGGVVSAVAASAAACVVMARRRAAGQQQPSLTAEEYHNDNIDI